MSGMLASKLDLPLQSTFDFIFSPKAQSVDTHPLWDILGKDFENEDAHTHTHFCHWIRGNPLGSLGKSTNAFSGAPTSLSLWLSLEQLESLGNNPLGLRWMSKSALTLHKIVSCYLLMQQLLLSSY